MSNYPDNIHDFDHDPRSPFYDGDDSDEVVFGTYDGTDPQALAAYHKNNPLLAVRIATKAVRHFVSEQPCADRYPQDFDFWKQVVKAWWKARRDAQAAVQAWSCRRQDLIRTLEGLGWKADWGLVNESELRRWVDEARAERSE